MVLPFNLIEGLIFAVSFWLLYVLLKPTLKHYEINKHFLMKGSFALYFSSFLAIWLSSILKRWSVLINRFRLPFVGLARLFDSSIPVRLRI